MSSPEDQAKKMEPTPCECLKKLDELRMMHEEGTIESFLVVLQKKDGKFDAFSHKPNPKLASSTAGYLAGLIDDMTIDDEEEGEK